MKMKNLFEKIKKISLINYTIALVCAIYIILLIIADI